MTLAQNTLINKIDILDIWKEYLFSLLFVNWGKSFTLFDILRYIKIVGSIVFDSLIGLGLHNVFSPFFVLFSFAS